MMLGAGSGCLQFQLQAPQQPPNLVFGWLGGRCGGSGGPPPPLASMLLVSGLAEARAAEARAEAGGGLRSCCKELRQREGQREGQREERQRQGRGAGAEGSEQQQQQQQWRRRLQGLSGTWVKDRERSGSMEAALDMVHLNGLVRQAVKLVRGVRIEHDSETFIFAVFSVVSWFKVKEVYPLSGEPRRHRRRDLRRGGAQGWVEPLGPSLQIQQRWSDPWGGRGTDYFRLVSEDELHIESVLQVGGQTAKYVTVYNKKHDR
ncbi:hypothetical protein Agub_g7265 [Astrephomene gubernaculifera]|uniref:Uncharacterized protein n=1 Tax=Astrephomene gubernaculifera TaxID=47775 RepID=A0AAD3DPT3_9CHLO|nr:hypothetical protein Agub_g7265 [Astrephomene gubernaculifera]